MQECYPINIFFRKASACSVLLMIVIFFTPVYAETLQNRQHVLEPLFDAPCARYQVPKVLALAIARQESGCHPWIINISGRDVRPRSKEEAIQYAQWAMRSGRSFDVGIMQINAYWIKRYCWNLPTISRSVSGYLRRRFGGTVLTGKPWPITTHRFTRIRSGDVPMPALL
mgnify:CR=1 FL=1